MTNSDRRHQVVVLCYPGVELLDLAGPINVLTAAARLGAAYRVKLVAERPGPVRSAGGVEVLARSAKNLRGAIDTLIVPGGLSPELDQALLVRRLARRSARIAGVCTGALILAEAGLLSGKRAATHWAACQALARMAPDCRVDDDAIYVRDGEVWTSAGVTAGMDLALALVEEDQGPELALEVARWLVLYLRRPGGQSQFSAPLAAQKARRGPIAELALWAREHLAADLTVPALARRADMSPRNFSRVFAREVGTSPAAWVERLRVEAARADLEASDAPIKAIARSCGFKSAATLHRAFKRITGATPAEYRERFRSPNQKG